MHPNQSGLDLGLSEAILEQRIRPDLDHFASTAFEEAARMYVAKLAQMGKLCFIPERIGSWWNRETEIDVLAISQNEKAALAAECKWSVNPIGTNVLENLKQKNFADAGLQNKRDPVCIILPIRVYASIDGRS